MKYSGTSASNNRSFYCFRKSLVLVLMKLTTLICIAGFLSSVSSLEVGELREQLVFTKNITHQELKKRGRHEESPLLQIFEESSKDCSPSYYPSRK